jgi:hypothetical protein
MEMKAYMKEYNKKYYIKNKDKLLAYSLSKKKCLVCNRHYHISHFARHLKTTKHKSNFNKSNNEKSSLESKNHI